MKLIPCIGEVRGAGTEPTQQRNCFVSTKVFDQHTSCHVRGRHFYVFQLITSLFPWDLSMSSIGVHGFFNSPVVITEGGMFPSMPRFWINRLGIAQMLQSSRNGFSSFSNPEHICPKVLNGTSRTEEAANPSTQLQPPTKFLGSLKSTKLSWLMSMSPIHLTEDCTIPLDIADNTGEFSLL